MGGDMAELPGLGCSHGPIILTPPFCMYTGAEVDGALGILGNVPAEIVDVRESHTQLAYRVAAIWG